LNLKVHQGLRIRLDTFEGRAGAAMEHIGDKLGQDSRWNGPGLQPLRADLLREAVRFWDEAIEIDKFANGAPGKRTPFYLRKPSVCLARLGEHERASKEVEQAMNLAGQPAGEAIYDFSQVYALCSSAAKDNGELAERYANRAMQLLQMADKMGFFDEAAN